MAYCCQCGVEVRPTDVFCGKCGARQPSSPAAAPDPLAGMSPRTASMLCYIPVVGWIPAIVILATDRFRSDRVVRFHAFQGIFLFVAWLVVDWVLGPMFGVLHVPGAIASRGLFPVWMLGKLFKAAVFVAWIVMLIKTSQGVMFKLPILGDLAERSVAEQR